MTPEQIETIRHRLGKARQALGEARGLFDLGYTIGVVNRTYYACFYAVSALLVSEGLSTSKHSGVLSLFSQHWIKTRRLDTELWDFYKDLFDMRLTGDYQDVPAFDRADAERWLGEAEDFVNQITGWLRENAGVE
jgi:uncharacterized protein (UPF0332 family)